MPATSAPLQEIEHQNWESLTSCARLGKDFLEGNNLQGYAAAATACLEEDESPTLGILEELLDLQGQQVDGIGCFATILASSGTGKTQLAATASMFDQLKLSGATVLYTNMSLSSQSFYKPHQVLGGTILDGLKWLKEYLSKNYGQNATSIRKWVTEQEDNKVNMFFGFLYYLLFKELHDGKKQTSLSSLHSAVCERGPFLFFLDEVPAKRDQSEKFALALFFRDLLRSLGIAPILMSTHSGAENYIEEASRSDDSLWVKIITRLPPFKVSGGLQLQDSHLAVFETSERPLVSALAADFFQKGLNLAQVVARIRVSIQQSKPTPWTSAPSLQLMQSFATKLVFTTNTYKNVHHVVGKHFGSVVTPSEAVSLTPGEAGTFKQTARMRFVSGELEPLLYLALMSWDDSCLDKNAGGMFPLTHQGKAISVMKAFRDSENLFDPWIAVENDKVNQSDGNLLEALVHASLTLASLKTDCIAGTFLGGVPLKNFLSLVSKLMKNGDFDPTIKDQAVLNETALEYDWFTVPALGGSNSLLSKKLNGVDGTKIGVLERPVNSKQNDGLIWETDNDGKKTSHQIMVECKNWKDGLPKSELEEIFARIGREIKCCLIFTTKLKANVYSDTTRTEFDAAMKLKQNPAFEGKAVSVIEWFADREEARFLEISLKDEAEKEEWKPNFVPTSLLVVIFCVDHVSAAPKIGDIGIPHKRKVATREECIEVLKRLKKPTA